MFPELPVKKGDRSRGIAATCRVAGAGQWAVRSVHHGEDNIRIKDMAGFPDEVERYRGCFF